MHGSVRISAKEKHWDVGTHGKMQINVLIPELRSPQPQSWGDCQLEELILGKTSRAVMEINGIFSWKGTGGGIKDLTLARKPRSLNVCVSAELGTPQTGCALLSQPDSFRGVTGHGANQEWHIPVGLGKPRKMGSLQRAELDILAPK